MRRLLFVPALIIPPLMLLNILSVALGHGIVLEASGFGKIENCRLPCWNGILAGQTPIKEADTILRQLGFELQKPDDVERLSSALSYGAPDTNAVCQVGLGRTQGVIPRVSELTLRFCGEAFLGHIIEMLGEPDSILPIVSLVNYRQGQVVAVLRSPMCESAPTPHTRLLFINLTPQIVAQSQSSILQAEQISQNDSTSTNLPWHGFAPVWRYNQLFPGRAIC